MKCARQPVWVLFFPLIFAGSRIGTTRSVMVLVSVILFLGAIEAGSEEIKVEIRIGGKVASLTFGESQDSIQTKVAVPLLAEPIKFYQPEGIVMGLRDRSKFSEFVVDLDRDRMVRVTFFSNYKARMNLSSEKYSLGESVIMGESCETLKKLSRHFEDKLQTAT